MEVNIDKHIEFRAKRDGRMRPFIAGTRVEVQYIVKDHEWHSLDAEEIARSYDHVSIAQVHAALAYYHDNRDEVRQMIREDEALVEKLRQQEEANEYRGGNTDEASPTVSS